MEQNNREAARSVFISLTAAEVIWGYVDSTLKICADNRISVTLKLCRAIKAMRVTYNNFVEKSLDRQHRENVREAAKAFQQQNVELCQKILARRLMEIEVTEL